jgi:hypothetical protein
MGHSKRFQAFMKWISFFLLTSFVFMNSAFSVYRPSESREISGESLVLKAETLEIIPGLSLKSIETPRIQDDIFRPLSETTSIEEASRYCRHLRQCSEQACQPEGFMKVSYIAQTLNTTYLD